MSTTEVPSKELIKPNHPSSMSWLSTTWPIGVQGLRPGTLFLNTLPSITANCVGKVGSLYPAMSFSMSMFGIQSEARAGLRSGYTNYGLFWYMFSRTKLLPSLLSYRDGVGVGISLTEPLGEKDDIFGSRGFELGYDMTNDSISYNIVIECKL